MSLTGIKFRRATLDDLEGLRGLWRESRLPEFELERRFTEFQLALDSHDWIVGALALRFAGQHAQVHSLAIRRPDLEAELVPALWSRVLALANQQGTHRLWTLEHGPFWTETGFRKPTPAELRELPPPFGPPQGAWLTHRLREEPLKLVAAEEQLAAFLELERMKTERLVRRGQALKIMATAFAAALFGLALLALFIMLAERRKGRPIPQP